MKLKTNNNVVVEYPFTNLDITFRCRCHKLLRKSALHDRIYEVSEIDQNEIISSKRHKCGRNKTKQSRSHPTGGGQSV